MRRRSAAGWKKARTCADGKDRAGFDWTELIKSGAQCGLTPRELWDMELWEYNAYVTACGEKRSLDTAYCILAGYYAAYYTNGGRKAKSPDELIRRLGAKKQTADEGMRAIERVKALERKKESEHG